MGQPKRGLSRRGLGRAFARLWVILLVACGLYVGFAKAGVFHNPLFVMTEGDIDLARSDTPGIRILFVGNSFTFYNDMPHMLHELAAEDPGAPPSSRSRGSRGSWWLEGATDDKGLVSLVDEIDWDAVVLQERSMVSCGVAGLLDGRVVSICGRSSPEDRVSAGDPGFLFETWAYRDGLAKRDSYD